MNRGLCHHTRARDLLSLQRGHAADHLSALRSVSY